jgi:NADH-quinone oxidoreductase subunit M
VRDFGSGSIGGSGWREELDWSWIPQFGIHFHLGMDGLSFLLVLLTLFLGVVAVVVSWTEIATAVGFYHFNLLLILAGILGVLLSLDLFLFYFSWELMLVPMYFLISVWGRERRIRAAVKFFLFTQLSGLLMLIALLALYFAHHQATGVYTFEYQDLLGTPLGPHAAMWIMLGFLAAFAVKLPIFPFHTWLPDACAEASAATNLVLASLMAATAAYAMIRFLLPLFPEAVHAISPLMIVLAVIGILYSAILAFSQTNLMRLVAYASIGHLGFVLLAIFAGNSLALRGAVMTVIAHGVSIGALFLVAGAVEKRVQSREIDTMGGLWETMPRLSGVGLFFALAALGLPGLGDFIGEFLILIGTYQAHIAAATGASSGVLAATLYALRFVQYAFPGTNVHSWHLPDLATHEGLVLGVLIVVLLWLGLYPQPVFQTLAQAASHAPALWR